MNSSRRLALVLMPFTLGACEWFTDFKDQPRVEPWEMLTDSLRPRGNPTMSVSIYGSAMPEWRVSYAPTPMAVDSIGQRLTNPVAADARSLANGRKYYQINCAVCHGDLGRGDGPTIAYGFPGISIVSDITRNRTDGYIWGIIRNGRGVMPTYNRIEELDRWDVVNYVRGLQGRYAVETGPVAAPGVTGPAVPGATTTAPTRPPPHAGAGPVIEMRADLGAPPPADSTARADTARREPQP